MEIVYFVSASHCYQDAIYFGVGPSFGAAYGWRVETMDKLAMSHCDVAVLDNRLEPADVEAIEAFLSKPADRRFPILFRVSDPDMVASANPCVQFIFRCGDTPGVHFATTYDPEGPFRAFTQTLARSQVIHLPYPYERRREIERDFPQRQPRLFLSGASNRRLYPLRHKLRRLRRWNPFLRTLVTDLPHPGYPDTGARLKHDIVRERFVEYASQFTHFFICPTVYESELAKYTECAYAGAVPLGQPPRSLKPYVMDCFIDWRGSASELRRALHSDIDEMRSRASTYRNIMRVFRDPARLRQDFVSQLGKL